MSEQTQSNPIQLVEETRQALQSLRSALIELYDAVEADPGAPQDVSRKFGLNRNLTWKLARVISAPEAFASLNHLPGQQGLQLALSAFENAGAPLPTVKQVRTALDQFSSVVAAHAGDRDHLELTLESMGLFEREANADSGRELAYRGNSMVWGAQARTRVSLNFLGPSASGDPNTTDIVSVLGLVGFRRLRASARWRLFSAILTDDAGQELTGSYSFDEVDPREPGDPPMFMRQFSSPNAPLIDVVGSPKGSDFYLPGGEVGNKGAFDIYFGSICRGLPLHRTPGNDYGWHAASITLPAETLIFDLISHRDLDLPDPDVNAYGFAQGEADSVAIQTATNRIPLSERLIELAGPPPAMATSHVPGITRIADRIYKRMGWDRTQFRAQRLLVPFPPMSSRVVVRWPLREPPV